MQRLANALRQKMVVLKGEQSPDNNDNHEHEEPMTSLNDDNDHDVAQGILSRLGKLDSNDPDRRALSGEREITAVEHIRQNETWDCGLACVQMILHWLRQNNIDDRQHLCVNPHNGEEEILKDKIIERKRNEMVWMMDFVATKSVWTIDLVMLLEYFLSGSNTNNNDNSLENEPECFLGCQQQNRPHPLTPAACPSSSWSYLFCSTKFGVDEAFNELEYYKDAFSADELRVKKLFDIAKRESLPLLQTSRISLGVLVDVVARKGVVAIVLLDNRILRNKNDASYSGHYVVLCGISYDENDMNYARMNYPEAEHGTRHNFCMVVKNPGLWKQTEFVVPSVFEKAWRAKGTDEDVIFLSKHEQ